MSRNSEKAQSMLYRFREQQAAEMGLGNRVKGDRRPRMASSVSSLRECERWRGDILRDISRKVSKIQDITLTDYEIRDLNDEINSLFREKRHWETQIVNLGGANYKRGNVAMTDDQGKEVPGTRGYKYFGRAKELPGVKELFTRGAAQATEESARNASFQMFRHQGPSYYGDEDEMDPALAEEEDELARKDWEEAARETASILSLDPSSSDLPSYPIASSSTSAFASSATVPAGAAVTNGSSTSSKRKAGKETVVDGAEDANANADADADGQADDEVNGATEADGAKRAKTSSTSDTLSSTNQNAAHTQAQAQALAQALSFFAALDPDTLKFPVVPTREEMEGVLLEVRKKALRDEYGV
ncbi:hypothetical protein IAT40_003470 [Kwoniella sp. CBS 6097]